MLQISPQRSHRRVELNELDRLAVVDVPVKQHPHGGGGFAINGKLHAAVAQHRAVGQRIAELHLRLGRFAGSFRHDNKGVSGKKIRRGRNVNMVLRARVEKNGKFANGAMDKSIGCTD